jgi:predicted nuclease of predicted toxin-antitoxin system
MKLFLDQDVYAITARYLNQLGYDVILAAQLGLSRAKDEEFLKEAEDQGRIFVTRDKDFGNLVFVKGTGSGVIYLRILPSTQEEVHKELAKVLKLYTEDELSKSFVVIEAKGHRIRRVKE